jgi:hypothetical protein
MDRRWPDHQKLDVHPFAVVMVLALSNRPAHLKPLVPALLEALKDAAPGSLTVVGA